MALIHESPLVAFRDCNDCIKYVYNEEKGERASHVGNPVPRNGGKPPCGYGPKMCAKGSPTAGRALTNQNWQAYRHYLQCRATGNFPDDPIVARNAAVIRSIEDAYEGSRTA